jgi:hypothetical protein
MSVLAISHSTSNVVAALESRSTAYCVCDCQKFLYKQAHKANQLASFAVENHAHRPTSILSQLSSTQISQANNQPNRQAGRQTSKQ